MIIFEAHTPKGDHIQVERVEYDYDEYWVHRLIVNNHLIVEGNTDKIFDKLQDYI